MISIQKNIPLAPYTTFKIGGPAKFFVEVKNQEELGEAFLYAKKNNLEIFILGSGSNILVSDEGFRGLMIRLINDSCSFRKNFVECDGGVQLSKVVSLATENGLTGLEWAAGIPGSIGGAIRGNAGAFGGEMANVIKEVTIFNKTGLTEIYDSKKCVFSYRNSIFKENRKLIVLSTVLELQEGDKDNIEAKVRENIKKRLERQPKGIASAGSFFENPVVTDKKLISNFEKDTGSLIKDNKIPAGWLIAEVGLLGKKIRGAKVSEDHGNFVINTGDATAQDVIILASLIKQRVRSKLGVQLKEEVQYVGF